MSIRGQKQTSQVNQKEEMEERERKKEGGKLTIFNHSVYL